MSLLSKPEMHAGSFDGKQCSSGRPRHSGGHGHQSELANYGQARFGIGGFWLLNRHPNWHRAGTPSAVNRQLSPSRDIPAASDTGYSS